ncbi:MAG: tetratricopeptide repeat protein [Elusimicrobiota bacterium]
MRLINIIFKPSKEIDKIAEKEPVFSTMLIFVISVIFGNINTVKDFAVNWQSFLFHCFILIILWLGAIILVDLILTGVLKLVRTLTSAVLMKDRFRKLLLIQLNFSLILIFRPIVSVVLGSRMSWIIIFIWAMILMILTVTKLWNVYEIKAALSIGVGVSIILIAGKVLALPSAYCFSEDFLKLKKTVDKKVTFSQINQVGTPDKLDYKKIEKTEREINDFVKNNPDSCIIPYCILIRARLLYVLNDVEPASKLWKDLLEIEELPDSLYRTALVNLKKNLNEEDYVLISLPGPYKKWLKIIKLYNLPEVFSYYRANEENILYARKVILEANEQDFESKKDILIKNYINTPFEDEVYFWLGERYMNRMDLDKAEKYFLKCSDCSSQKSKQRIKVESAVDFIMQKISPSINEVLIDKFRAPYALFKLAEINRLKKDDKRAEKIYKKIIKTYPDHYASAKSLYELAQIAGKEKKNKKMMKYYNKIKRRFPMSNFKMNSERSL